MQAYKYVLKHDCHGMICLAALTAVFCRYATAVTVTVTAETRSAADYLSEDDFPGLHILEPRGDSLFIFKNGQNTSEPAEIKGVGEWHIMHDARLALEETLAIRPPEPLQKKWAIFDAQGRRVRELDDLLKLKVAFLIIIGEWMWPAVRVGFEHHASNVRGEEPLTLRTLSIRPVIFEIRDFILPDEAEALIEMGREGHMENSEGVLITEDLENERPHDDYRTSTQTWLDDSAGPLIKTLDRRTANLSRVHATHNEPVQLLRYKKGEFYHSHLDWTDLALYKGQKDEFRRAHYGWSDRLATLFWYLTDVKEGGETVFPKYGQPICPPDNQHCPGTSDVEPHQCDVGLRVKPKRGSVILWYNFHADGRGDQNALHGGCPPGEGDEKWSGNKWIGIKSQRSRVPPWMPEHPALKRAGWLTGKHGHKDICKLEIFNRQHHGVELWWIDTESKHEKHIGHVEALGHTEWDATKGHTFEVRMAKMTSRVFACHGRGSGFEIDEDFKLKHVPTEHGEL